MAHTHRVVSEMLKDAPDLGLCERDWRSEEHFQAARFHGPPRLCTDPKAHFGMHRQRCTVNVRIALDVRTWRFECQAPLVNMCPVHGFAEVQCACEVFVEQVALENVQLGVLHATVNKRLPMDEGAIRDSRVAPALGMVLPTLKAGSVAAVLVANETRALNELRGLLRFRATAYVAADHPRLRHLHRESCQTARQIDGHLSLPCFRDCVRLTDPTWVVFRTPYQIAPHALLLRAVCSGHVESKLWNAIQERLRRQLPEEKEVERQYLRDRMCYLSMLALDKQYTSAAPEGHAAPKEGVAGYSDTHVDPVTDRVRVMHQKGHCVYDPDAETRKNKPNVNDARTAVSTALLGVLDEVYVRSFVGAPVKIVIDCSEDAETMGIITSMCGQKHRIVTFTADLSCIFVYGH